MQIIVSALFRWLEQAGQKAGTPLPDMEFPVHLLEGGTQASNLHRAVSGRDGKSPSGTIERVLPLYRGRGRRLRDEGHREIAEGPARPQGATDQGTGASTAQRGREGPLH